MRKSFLFLAVAFLVAGCNSSKNSDPWAAMDDILGRISDPVFSPAEFLITDFGAVADSVTMNTFAIENAIAECNYNGGGTVIVPNGVFRTGAIHLKSNVCLHLADSATLLFSVDPKDYQPLVYTRWEGIDCFNYSPLIYAIDVENIGITGKGKLQGNATVNDWWPWKGNKKDGWIEGTPCQLDDYARPSLDSLNKNRVPVGERVMGEGFYLRPQFINIIRCRNVVIEDVTIENSPFWVIHPVFCENLTVRGVTINSLGPNNDGCDPESCKDVLIEKCYFNTGDDCIAIKSGRNADGIESNIPSENIIVRDCRMKNGHGGVVIGSEVSGGTRNVFVENCQMDSPELDRAIRLKSNSNRGGVTENLYVRNITVGEVSEAVLHINLIYDIKKEGEDSLYPIVRNVVMENVTSQKSQYGISIEGVEGRDCVSNIKLVNCNFKGVEDGNYLNNAGDVVLENVEINGEVMNTTIR